MQHLVAYRAGITPTIFPTVLPAGLRKWRIKTDLGAPARVRQGPGQDFPIAGRLKPDTLVYVDVVKHGDSVDGTTDWIHMANVPHEQADLGFLSATLGDWEA